MPTSSATATNATHKCSACGVKYRYDPAWPHRCGFTATATPDVSRGRADDPKHNEWQAEVLKMAVAAGFSADLHYHTYDSRKSTEGYPDLHMLNLGTMRSVYVECKVGGDKPSKEQSQWGMGLIRCGHEWYCLYPADREKWAAILQRKPDSQTPRRTRCSEAQGASALKEAK